MQGAGHQANHHAAKNARFQRLNAQRHPLSHRARILMRQRAVEDKQCVNCGVHHQKRQQRREPGGPFVGFRQTNGNPDGKQHREIGKHNRACAAQDREDGL